MTGFSQTYASLSRGFRLAQSGGLSIFGSPLLLSAGCKKHGFTGRSGGVSAPPYDSLNLGFSRPEPRENIMENYARLATAVSLPVETMALCSYAHGTGVYRVRVRDAGAGILSPPLPEADGLVTNENVTLVTLHADCLSVLFFDPQSGAAGACHAGWRGVAGGVAVNTLEAMAVLGAREEDVRVWVGPGICGDCYEVDEAVIDAFECALSRAGALAYKPGGKAQLDLSRAMAYQLLRAGVAARQLELSGLCTCCDSRFFSHRRDQGKTGAMAAFIAGRNGHNADGVV